MATQAITSELKEDLAILRDDLGVLMSAVKDIGVQQGQEIYGRVKEGGERLAVQAKATQENVGHYVEAKPFGSVLMAFGTGFAIGTLLSNRR